MNRSKDGTCQCTSAGVQVAESGLDFVIVRAAKSDGVDPSLQETGVSITPQGSLSKDAKVTKSQVCLPCFLQTCTINVTHMLEMHVIDEWDC